MIPAPFYPPYGRTASQTARPSVVDFKNHIAKTLRAHLRYAGDVHGPRPPAAAITHLVEYVVRTALREKWNVNGAINTYYYSVVQY